MVEEEQRSAGDGRSPKGGQPDSDAVQATIGDVGRWQVVVFLWIALLKFPVAWNMMAIVFLAPPVEARCQQDLNSSDHCMARGPNGTEERCTSWRYDRSVFTETIVTEWDLVCSRYQLSNVAQMVFMFGILTGNCLFGIAADRYGRKAPLVVAMMLQSLAGVAAAMVPWFEAFIALRFMVAFATGGSMITSFVLCVEIMGGKWRMITAVLNHLPFCLGHMTLALIAFYVRDWRTLQLVISLPSLLLVSYWWTLPESPRWLLTRGRESEAIEILEKVAKTNKMDASQVLPAVKTFIADKEKQQESLGENKASVLDLFRTPNLRRTTLCLYFNWMVCGFCFYGLAQYMGQIGGNIFINVFVNGTLELSGLLCIYFMGKFGRRNTMVGSQMLAAVACILITAVPRGPGAPEWPSVTLAAGGIVGATIAFFAVYLFSGELLPTVVRNAGMGSTSMCARVGSMLAPFVSSLNHVSTYIPPLLFGCFPLVAAILCLLLPETTGRDLPDTLEEGENFRRKQDGGAERGRANGNCASEDSAM
ncbi:organic cation transporter protein-like [Bacillus rossius redtenbacheri]|uniref:organic cation transporter protein-like n=1 Tax=Bacillus rossius redtenbacheri TaxID=93214 RepID=UPI002FDD9491